MFTIKKLLLGSCLVKMSFTQLEKHESSNERILRLLKLVQEEGKINRYEAYSLLGWTPGIYERVHPAFISRHYPAVIYDKKTRNYIFSVSVQEKII